MGFVEQGRKEMKSFIVKAINDHLTILGGEIVFPRDKNGEILASKLLAVVKSREVAYVNACSLMDLIEIDRSTDNKYKARVINALKTTWHELTAILTMDMRDNEDYNEEEEEDKNFFTDDYLSSISNAKKLSAELSQQILDRIEMLENPEVVLERKVEDQKSVYIIEEFTDYGQII